MFLFVGPAKPIWSLAPVIAIVWLFIQVFSINLQNSPKKSMTVRRNASKNKEVLQLAQACVYPGTTQINCSSNRKKKNKKLAIAAISNTKLVNSLKKSDSETKLVEVRNFFCCLFNQ